MLQSNSPDRSLIFLLGSQRSGTTWLANIFDASPKTLLFMEPFAPTFNILPEFPEASLFLEHSSPALDRLLREEMPKRLLRYKYLFFQRSLTDPAWFRVERSLDALVRYFGAFAPNLLFEHAHKFHLLNLNRTDNSFPGFPKETIPSTWVIKELRLAGKIPILLSAYPNARYVVIIRHPGATVHSIMTWFSRNKLGELQQDLDTYFEKIEAQRVARPYQGLIERCRNAGLAHRVALYWRINYETMYRKLKDNPLAKFVVYEQLAQEPQRTMTSLFSWLDLPWSASVSDYLAYSTSSLPKQITAITTVRDSAKEYRTWLNKIDEPTRRAVEEIVGTSHLMAWFSPYYSIE